METTATVINVRSGIIEENQQPWAHMNIISADLQVEEGFYGVSAAKMKFTDTQIANRLISDLRKSDISMPCQMKITLEQKLQANEMKTFVSGYQLIK